MFYSNTHTNEGKFSISAYEIAKRDLFGYCNAVLKKQKCIEARNEKLNENCIRPPCYLQVGYNLYIYIYSCYYRLRRNFITLSVLHCKEFIIKYFCIFLLLLLSSMKLYRSIKIYAIYKRFMWIIFKYLKLLLLLIFYDQDITGD